VEEAATFANGLVGGTLPYAYFEKEVT
jgi:hypothetical protein